MVDWLPVKPLKDLRHIMEVMDRSSRTIFEQKKSALGGPEDDVSVDADASRDDDLGARSKGRDFMSIMCTKITISSTYLYAN